MNLRDFQKTLKKAEELVMEDAENLLIEVWYTFVDNGIYADGFMVNQFIEEISKRREAIA